MEVVNRNLLPLASIAVVVGLFIAVFATRNRDGHYAPVGAFTGCYSNGTNRLILGADGGLDVNGIAAGSYRIVKPVGGKHGYLVEAAGLTLAGGRETPVRVTPGSGGFFWPVDNGAIHLNFAPGVALVLKKRPRPSC